MSKTFKLAACRKDLLDIYNYALSAVKPDTLFAGNLRVEGHKLKIKHHVGASGTSDIELDIKNSKIHVIGAGKSVLSMASGLADVATQAKITDKFSFGALSLPIGIRDHYDANTRNKLNSIGVECFFGSKNNLPDEDSIFAAGKILDNIEAASHEDRLSNNEPLFLVLLSGGGSACLASPRYINLDQKLELIKHLVQRGADIVELNKVRRYFSNVKGGRLAERILSSNAKAKILSFIISDVIGDPIEHIASGPTHLEVSVDSLNHKQEASEILMKYSYENLDLLECNQPNNIPESRQNFKNRILINHIIGNNKIALNAALVRARQLGYEAKCFSDQLQGNSRDVVEKLCKFGDNMKSYSTEKLLVIAGGEATVDRLRGESWGKGGRAQEMGLDYSILKLSNPRKDDYLDYFLAGGTDGQDGPTDVGLIAVSIAEWGIASSENIPTVLKLQEAKKAHNSYDFWSEHRPDWLVRTGMTGTNVMDLYMYLLSNR